MHSATKPKVRPRERELRDYVNSEIRSLRQNLPPRGEQPIGWLARDSFPLRASFWDPEAEGHEGTGPYINTECSALDSQQ